VTDAEIEALEDPKSWGATFDARTRVALQLADTMCGATHQLDTELTEALREHFSEVELAELILVAGQANLNNRAGNVAKQLLG